MVKEPSFGMSWCGDIHLLVAFSDLYYFAVNKDAMIAEYLSLCHRTVRVHSSLDLSMTGIRG